MEDNIRKPEEKQEPICPTCEASYFSSIHSQECEDCDKMSEHYYPKSIQQLQQRIKELEAERAAYIKQVSELNNALFEERRIRQKNIKIEQLKNR